MRLLNKFTRIFFCEANQSSLALGKFLSFELERTSPGEATKIEDAIGKGACKTQKGEVKKKSPFTL